MVKPEDSQTEIRRFLNAHQEWLLIHASGKSFALQKSEFEISFERGKMLFGFLDAKGFQVWRVREFQISNGEILFDLTRNFEKERDKVRLVPRTSAREMSAAVELARLEKANEIARLIAKNFPPAKLVRVALNQETGRFAQIIFENARKKQTAALADVSDQAAPEILLTSALFWLTKLQNRRKNPIDDVWILAEKRAAKNLQRLHALLCKNWKNRIKILEISGEGVEELDELTINDLWREKPTKLALAGSAEISRTAREIVALAPAKTDIIFSKNGETVRFLGLPFARVRKVFEKEKAWFGIERDRRILTETSRADFEKLLEDLKIYRRADSPNKRHALFRLAPEAWLEAILRQNIKLLDANLILSPIYNQFRTARDKIDLLALRRDGRLIIIELKVAPDREMIFQAADYWRKIELLRRRGELEKARVFGEKRIADAPALVYLVAPTLSFHRDFSFLAKTVSNEIEIFRFDLNENWRADLKVLRRERI